MDDSRSIGPDVSPMSSPPPPHALDCRSSSSSGASKSIDDGNGAATTISSSGTADLQPHKSTISFASQLPRPDRSGVSSRKASISTLSTLSPQLRADGSRIRASSPPHQR
ncbi:hypothetical protein GQ602_005987 [Ophiocordyceps camponoti-floridani]|uniref:Uncharacterized protein n=1 Tax=Ophiocordyceps camponoti-floridani TaxID=2030778 RepID=A0A8H4Q2F1_9HYPO|nr:hypothetical protein GQ602_005987 [Ophiocordyceps camponoti-floridani]